MIGILNLETCNLRSVYNAVYEQGFDPLIINQKESFDSISHLIIPGVGHFNKAYEAIIKKGFLAPLIKFKNDKKPILGICLGMQLLANFSDEGNTKGLNFIPGTIKKLEGSENIRLPHIGWNTISLMSSHPVLASIKNDRDFYFVHSYHYIPENRNDYLASCHYHQNFCAIVKNENVIGCQFHPEKSQKNGLKLIENFCEWDGQC